MCSEINGAELRVVLSKALEIQKFLLQYIFKAKLERRRAKYLIYGLSTRANILSSTFLKHITISSLASTLNIKRLKGGQNQKV